MGKAKMEAVVNGHFDYQNASLHFLDHQNSLCSSVSL